MARFWPVVALVALVAVCAAGVNVTIHLRDGLTGVPPQVALTIGGGKVYSASKRGVIYADVSPSAAKHLSALRAVRSVRPALPPLVRRTTNAAVAALNVAEWRSLYGVDGSGVRVGVISDSASPSSVAAMKASGDLPRTRVTVLSAGSGTDEGTAMMTLVHAVAPGAHLVFHDCGNTEEEMAEAIAALVDNGCDVIVDDIGWGLEAPLHAAGSIVDEIGAAAAAGVAYLSSAGNDGAYARGTSTTWEGPWRSVNDTDDWLDFGTQWPYGGLRLLGPATPIAIVMWWSDPLGASENDYDLFLLDNSGSPVAGSADAQDGTQDPVEVIVLGSEINFAASNYTIVVYKYVNEDTHAPVQDRYVRIQLFGCGGVCRVEPATAGNTYGHAAVVGMAGIAAVNAAECGGGSCEGRTMDTAFYSSDGPRRIFYGADGVTPVTLNLTAGVALTKPDLSGIDGVNSGVDGFAPFYGTSAAAPHVAALAALLLQAAPTASPASIFSAMRASSLAVGGAGGAGLPWVGEVLGALCGDGEYLRPSDLTCAACAFGQTGSIGSSTCTSNPVPTVPAQSSAPRGSPTPLLAAIVAAWAAYAASL
jgi:subtilisin family serine protease